MQTRTWTVGEHDRDRLAPGRRHHVAHARTRIRWPADEVVFVETNHPADRVLPVTWTLNGTAIPNPRNSRNLDLGALNVPAGTSHARGQGHRRRALGHGRVEDRQGRPDRGPSPVHAAHHAHRRRSSTRSTSAAGTCGWIPKDDTTGYRARPPSSASCASTATAGSTTSASRRSRAGVAVRVPLLRPGREGAHVRQPRHGRALDGRLRADAAGRSPDRPPHPRLRHAHRRAPGDRPGGQLRQGGVLPRDGAPRLAPACGTTADRRADQRQRHERRHVPLGRDGQRRRDGRLAAARSWRRTAPSAARSTPPAPRPCSCSARTVNGAARIAGSTRDVTIAGSTFKGGLALTGNTQVTASERYSRLAGAYGPILAGSTVNGTLECSGNSADVKDFGAPNTIRGGYSGCALAPVSPEAPVVRHRPGHAVADARRPGRRSARSRRAWPGSTRPPRRPT